MARAFWISTGDISGEYDPLDIVMTRVAADTPAFRQIDYAALYRKAVEDLSRGAKALGADAVIWITFQAAHSPNVGAEVFATGTAVKVRGARVEP